MDFAVIGLFLVFLRLTYLALTSSLIKKDISADLEKNVLVSNVIGIGVFRVAQCCFSHFNYNQCNDIQVLQLALYIKIYYTYAPEEGDGLDNRHSRTLNPAIIQMTYSLGFSRDPSHLCYKFSNPRLNNLGRKIWHFVRCLDNENTILFGDPLAASIIPFDTKIPYYSQGIENSTNQNLEGDIIQVFTNIKTHLELLKTVFDIFFNEEGININRLLDSFSCLESYLQDGDIILKAQLNVNDLVTLENMVNLVTLENMVKLKGMLDIRFLMSSIYFKMFIHYEKKKNDGLVYFYAKKLLKISVIDIFPYYLKILKDTNVLDEFSLFYIIPSLIRLSQKIISSLSFILIRVKYFEFQNEHSGG